MAIDDEDHLFDDEGLEDEPERAMDAGGDNPPGDFPIDPPIIPGGRDGAIIPGAGDGFEDDDGDDDEDEDDVGPLEAMADDEISARVRRLLRTDAATSMLRIHVTTEDGVVTLRGLVQTLEDTDNAAEVASRAPNVVDVVDELEVEV